MKRTLIAATAAFDRVCTFGCEEYTDLKKAVAEFEAKAKK